MEMKKQRSEPSDFEAWNKKQRSLRERQSVNLASYSSKHIVHWTIIVRTADEN